jgi:hypothetical protein
MGNIYDANLSDSLIQTLVGEWDKKTDKASKEAQIILRQIDTLAKDQLKDDEQTNTSTLNSGKQDFEKEKFDRDLEFKNRQLEISHEEKMAEIALRQAQLDAEEERKKYERIQEKRKLDLEERKLDLEEKKQKALEEYQAREFLLRQLELDAKNEQAQREYEIEEMKISVKEKEIQEIKKTRKTQFVSTVFDTGAKIAATGMGMIVYKEIIERVLAIEVSGSVLTKAVQFLPKSIKLL